MFHRPFARASSVARSFVSAKPLAIRWPLARASHEIACMNARYGTNNVMVLLAGHVPGQAQPSLRHWPALTTSVTRLSLVQSLYGTHYHSHLCLIITYHILDHMYGCILHITSAILCILCYLA